MTVTAEEVKGNANDPQFEVNEEEEVYEQTGIDKWFNLLLCRTDLAHEKLEAKPVSFTQLFRFGSRLDKVYVYTGILLSIICGIAQPMFVLINGRMVNVLVLSNNTYHSDKLWNEGFAYVGAFGGLGVFLLIFTFLQYFCLKFACLHIICNMRKRYIESILKQNAAWMDTQKAGTLITQLNENIDRVRDGIGDKIGLLCRSVTMYFTSITIAFIFDWKMTFIMVGVGPASAILMSIMAKLINSSANKQMELVGKAGGIMEECILNVKTVSSCNGQETMIQKYSSVLKEGRFHAILTYFWNGLFDGAFFIILYFSFGGGFYYGGKAYYDGEMDEPGDMFIVAVAILFGSYFLGVVSPHLVTVLKARVAAAIIYKTIDRVPLIDSSDPKGQVLENPRGLVELKDVHFTYPTRKDHKVLHGLSWTANPGETVALVGHSGSGKSTSIGLLTRLYECSSGQILIDGVDVREIRISNLRNIVGIVEQEPTLFNGTIAENIRLGNPDISDEKMEEVCKMANAHDFIVTLNNKYDTVIGAGGVQLSGGQKQRIAIARAISRNPKILLLDEATSALDAESETIVQNALKKASEGRTTIVIAHRLSTLRDVSKIYVVDSGLVIESGSHAELMALEDGVFARLVKAQQFKEVDSSSQEGEKHEEKPDKINEFQRSIIRASNTSVLSGDRASLRQRGNTAMSMAKIDEVGEIATTKKTHGIFRLYANCKGTYIPLVLAFIITSIRGLELPLYSFLLGDAFNTVQAKDDPDYMTNLTRFLILSCALGVGSSLAIMGAATMFGYTAENVVDSYRIRSFTNIMYQDASFFDRPKMSAPNVITTISSSAPMLKGALDNRMVHIANNGTAIIVIIIASLVMNYALGLAGLALLAILCVLIIFFGHKMSQYSKHDTDELSKAAIEIVEQVRTIQLLTRETTFHEHYSRHLEAQLAIHSKISYFDGMMFACAQSFMYFADVVCFGLGIVMIYNGNTTPMTVYIVATLIECACWCIVFASACLGDFLQAGVAADSLLELIEAKSVTGDTTVGQKTEIAGNVSLQNVQFSYPSRPHVKVTNGLNLKANRGETIALVGPSGGGKSTTINLLQRFYDYQHGSVNVDGTNVRAISLDNLRSQMALVGQEPVLFSGSIEENIRLGVPDATLGDVKEACQKANAAKFIEALPLGYDSEVGEKGAQLSGGQKQRIAIARALVRNPKILLLDEATSALDTESERAVQEALDVASSGRTCITIAHRLSSIQHADKIYFIKEGRVVEAGTHAELMQMDALYAELIRKQDLKNH
uniref:ABC transporter ATP-binding protein n=1 Tax=Steinernema glaseri TaxID=37863 RepID=A0A1I7YWD3_9BILA